MQLGSIFVNFGANTSGFTSGINDMKRSMSLFSGSAPALMAGVGAAIAGVAVVMGVMAVKAAADFQQGLNRLITGAGDTTDNMNLMGQAIRGISTDTGVLTDKLLPAMYQIISAGQRGAQAQDTLAVAAKGSIVEQAKIVDVAKAITTVMTDFSNKHYTATQAMNGLTRATQLGKLTLEQLSTALSPILSTAANLGIHFSDLAAAMSTMTNAGVPAERAATSLRFLMQSLENPTKKATTAMQEMGLNTVAVGEEMKKSLPGALEMIYKAALKAGPEGSVPFNRALSDMIGGQRSLQAALSLTGTHFATFTDDAAKIAAAMGVSKTAVLGWDVAQKNFNVQLDKGKAAFQGLLITIGNMLLPVLTNLLTQITPLIQSFTDWLSNSDNLQNGLQTLSDIMAPLISAIQDTWTYLQPLIAQVIAWAQKNDVAGKALDLCPVARCRNQVYGAYYCAGDPGGYCLRLGAVGPPGACHPHHRGLHTHALDGNSRDIPGRVGYYHRCRQGRLGSTLRYHPGRHRYPLRQVGESLERYQGNIFYCLGGYQASGNWSSQDHPGCDCASAGECW